MTISKESTEIFNRFAPLGGDVTPPGMFFDRRRFLQGIALASAGLALPACSSREPEVRAIPALERPDVFPPPVNDAIQLPVAVERRQLTPREIAARHTNFYEFLPGQAGDVLPLADEFAVTPWRLEVRGACDKPRVFDLDDLFRFAHEERLYHFRCVERWAMNVPWAGFPLHRLLAEVEPRPEARWVRFESASDPRAMPGVARLSSAPWPYHEALRLDEAMHDLAFLATGIYGAPLPKQHGAPIRLVVPWKYGYKSAKSLVTIELVEEPPSTYWSQIAASEYGLLSNVNPNIPHPRWPQALSFWLRDDPVWPTADDTFPTPIFNGYEEVASLYPDEPRTAQYPLRSGEIAR